MTFNSNTLGRVWDACSPFIEGFFGRLDAINADIKELEERLNAARFHEVLWVEMSRGENEGSPEIAFSFIVESEILVWCKTGDRWRLLYRRLRDYNLNGEEVHDPEAGGFHGAVWDSVKILDSRPLLETPAEVRLRVENALRTVIEQVAKRRAASEHEVKSAVASAFIDDSDIPF